MIKMGTWKAIVYNDQATNPYEICETMVFQHPYAPTKDAAREAAEALMQEQYGPDRRLGDVWCER